MCLPCCCADLYDARMCRTINDASVMTMDGRKIAPGVGFEMADIFLKVGFGEASEDRRAALLAGKKEKVVATGNENFKL